MCARIHMGEHVPILFIYRETPVFNLQWFSLGAVQLYFLRWDFLLTEVSHLLKSLDWLASHLQGPVSASPLLGLNNIHCHPCLLCGFWDLSSGPQCLHSRHFPYWTVSPAPAVKGLPLFTLGFSSLHSYLFLCGFFLRLLRVSWTYQGPEVG